MKPKICIIGTLKFGIGHYIAHLYPELSDQFDLTILTYTHGSPGDELKMDDDLINENVKNYKQCINPHGLAMSTSSLNTLFDIFTQEKFNVLNLHISSYTRKSAYLFIPVIEHFKKQGLKVVYTMHDVLPTPENGKPTQYLEYFYNLADSAIVGNKQEQDNLRNIFHYKNAISIATHGVYTLFNRGTYTQKSAREKLKISDNKKMLLFFGILRENKGMNDLINALNILKDDYLLLVAISERMGTSFDSYQKLIENLNLGKYVKVIREDESSIDEIESYFQASDVVLLPYTSTSQSGILNLAFAFEKPSIITNVFAESAQLNNKMGLTTEPQNPLLLAQKIRQYFEEKDLKLPLFQKNIKEYNNKTNFKHTAEVYKKAFTDI